ncbi:hypothetical protein CLU80_4657 [Pseudomonas sp. 29]|jgi:hypothetical protein|nr:hypothetical protein CLU80_4657 [Pseudomonas sp. 29]SEN93690.1 hypothetical protein SAMN04487856_10576 [Pseudomonas sp. ok266]
MLFIGVGKTYRAVLLRSIEHMSQGMNASMKKGPANQHWRGLLYFKRWPYSAFASGAFSPWDRL